MNQLNFILASGNSHKAEEFSELFDSQVLSIKSAAHKLDVEETGTTYYENALIKARAYFDVFKMPTLADDSGLTVMALPGELGLYSARFGGAGLTDKERAMLLLEKMKDIAEDKRSAFFTCVLCFYISPLEIYFFEGRMEGKIARMYKGEGGFGYDPVFIPNKLGKEETVAQHSDWKKENCHRAIAGQHAQKFFRSSYCQ